MRISSSFLTHVFERGWKNIQSLFRKRYQKFIILGTARTGSTLLRSLLNSHGEVIAFGELFRNLEDIGWDLMPYQEELQSVEIKKLRLKYPVAFLKRAVFAQYPNNIRAVGFKIFYYQAQENSQKTLWTWLRKNQDLKVIHIKRRNYLKTLASLTKAHKTNKWYRANPEDCDNSPISLTYERCLEYFNWLQDTSIYHDELFERERKIDIYYEDLAGNFSSEMRKVQDFLYLSHEPLIPSTLKQSDQGLSEVISNYFELKLQFKDTPWFKFFED